MKKVLRYHLKIWLLYALKVYFYLLISINLTCTDLMYLKNLKLHYLKICFLDWHYMDLLSLGIDKSTTDKTVQLMKAELS